MSCLSTRMSYGTMALSPITHTKNSNSSSGTWTPQDLSTALATIKQEDHNFDYLVWLGKISVVTMIASGNSLLVQEMIAIYLHTALSDLTVFQNEIGHLTTAEGYYQCLHSGISKLDIFVGEVYIGIQEEFNRSKFLQGSEFEVTELLSASTMWKVATSYVKQYDKKGTIFIIKSKTGYFLGSYSKFIRDSEVVFLSGTRFIVTALYRGGDCIIFGQENIRDHTYKIKTEDLPDYLTTNRSMVIELTEV